MVLSLYFQLPFGKLHTITRKVVASHIILLSNNVKERLKPSNGICLSVLYDRAFVKGIMAKDSNDYTVMLSRELL